MYLRTVKVRSSNGTVNEYVRAVESYREDGKVKQRTIADLGRKDLLAKVFPKLRQLLDGDSDTQTLTSSDPQILDASTWGPVLAVRALFEQLGLWSILETHLGKAKGVPFADRAFVLIANRLIHPASEHRLAGWLETDFVCDRRGRRFLPHWHIRGRVRVHFRQLEAWYRTLDQLLEAKEQIELALYHRLRDLFSFKPDLVLYDITSTYFEGLDQPASPSTATVATASLKTCHRRCRHGGWLADPHHVGNTVDHKTVQRSSRFASAIPVPSHRVRR
jgi:hypothetical protein